MRPHPRRAETNSSSPRSWATCDRCGFVTNHYKLSWQFEWAGTQLINQKILVCEGGCLDQPNRQLGTIILPPDPTAVVNARPEQYYVDEWANILWEQHVPLNQGKFKQGFHTGDPIYSETSTPSTTTALALELAYYYQEFGPVFTAPPLYANPGTGPAVAGTVFNFSIISQSQYIPLVLGGFGG